MTRYLVTIHDGFDGNIGNTIAEVRLEVDDRGDVRDKAEEMLDEKYGRGSLERSKLDGYSWSVQEYA